MQKTEQHRLQRRQKRGNKSAAKLLQRWALLAVLGERELLSSFSAAPNRGTYPFAFPCFYDFGPWVRCRPRPCCSLAEHAVLPAHPQGPLAEKRRLFAAHSRGWRASILSLNKSLVLILYHKDRAWDDWQSPSSWTPGEPTSRDKFRSTEHAPKLPEPSPPSSRALNPNYQSLGLHCSVGAGAHLQWVGGGLQMEVPRLQSLSLSCGPSRQWGERKDFRIKYAAYLFFRLRFKFVGRI